MTIDDLTATAIALVPTGILLLLCLSRKVQTEYKYTPKECPEKGREAYERPRSRPWRIYWSSSGEDSVASARCAMCGTSVPSDTRITLHP